MNQPMSAPPRHGKSPTPVEARHVCPLCDSPLFRIPRRPFDRLLSVIVPVQRYRCSARKEDLSCSWEGVFRRRYSGEKEVSHLPTACR